MHQHVIIQHHTYQYTGGERNNQPKRSHARCSLIDHERIRKRLQEEVTLKFFWSSEESISKPIRKMYNTRPIFATNSRYIIDDSGKMVLRNALQRPIPEGPKRIPPKISNMTWGWFKQRSESDKARIIDMIIAAWTKKSPSTVWGGTRDTRILQHLCYRIHTMRCIYQKTWRRVISQFTIGRYKRKTKCYWVRVHNNK